MAYKFTHGKCNALVSVGDIVVFI